MRELSMTAPRQHLSGFPRAIGFAVIHGFKLMRLPRGANISWHVSYRAAKQREGRIYNMTQIGVALAYLILMHFLWDLERVFQYQKIELGIMAGTMVLTAGFLQAVAWAVARHYIERPHRSGPTVLMD